MTRVPSDEQLAALCKVQDFYGRTWKFMLSFRHWLKSDYLTIFRGDLLQQVRNSFGPSWLYSRACPKAMKEYRERREAAKALVQSIDKANGGCWDGKTAEER